MALKTVLDDLGGVDDALKPFYTQSNGKFVLALEGVDDHPDVANLKGAYERVKAAKSQASAELDAAKARLASLPEDFDPEKWAKLKDGKPDEAALVALRKELEADRDGWKGKYEAVTETARKNAIERDLSDALVSAGVTSQTFLKASRVMLESMVKVGEDGKAFVETDMGPLGLTDFVSRWAAKDGKEFVTAPTGAGATGGKGGNAKVKQITRAEYNALPVESQREHALSGGTVVD